MSKPEPVVNLGPDRDLGRLRQVWAWGMLALLAATWKLWIPRIDPPLPAVDFPAVPMLRIPQAAARLIDPLAIVAVLAGLTALAIGAKPRLPGESGLAGAMWRREGQGAALLVGLGLTAMMILNQHRIQAWAYQGWLYCWVFAAMGNATRCRRGLLLLTSTLYLYSAMGKFDQQFLRTVGPAFAARLFPRTAAAPEPDGTTADWGATVLMLPAIELLIGILVLIPRTRFWAGWGAVAMHSLLIVSLGPWGLKQSSGVILWNLMLAWQAIWLLVRHPCVASAGQPDSDRLSGAGDRWLRRIAVAVLGGAIILPLGERLPHGATYGYWDHWPSWALYSPHTSRTDIEVHRSALPLLPSSARSVARAIEGESGWLEIPLDRWSLAEFAAPVYPQARFQLGVASALSLGLPDDAIRAKVRSTADRLSGRRNETWLGSGTAIRQATQAYWLLPHLGDARSSPAATQRWPTNGRSP